MLPSICCGKEPRKIPGRNFASETRRSLRNPFAFDRLATATLELRLSEPEGATYPLGY